MTTRNTTVAAVLAAVLGAPAAVAAQEYELPDSLARYGIPADPNEFVRQIAAGDQLMIADLFVAGCPSEGGWAGAAFEAVKAAAETDPHVQRELAYKLGSQLQRARDHEHGGRDSNRPPDCPSELPAYEAWLAEQLRREWEQGLLGGPPVTMARGGWVVEDIDCWTRDAQARAAGGGKCQPEEVTVTGRGESVVVGTLLSKIVSGTEPSTRELVRDIAMDPAVWGPWRQDAAGRLVDLHFGRGNRDRPQVNSLEWERYVAATRAALFDLAASPPIPWCEPLEGECEWSMFEVATLAPGEASEAFKREYELALRAAGREVFWK